MKKLICCFVALCFTTLCFFGCNKKKSPIGGNPAGPGINVAGDDAKKAAELKKAGDDTKKAGDDTKKAGYDTKKAGDDTKKAGGDNSEILAGSNLYYVIPIAIFGILTLFCVCYKCCGGRSSTNPPAA